MNRKYRALGVLAVAGAVGAAALLTVTGHAPTPTADSQSASEPGQSTLGVSASMRFTDNQGRPRQPTAAERAALAAAFQRDLARLTRNNRMPTRSRPTPSGAVSAVVPPSRLRFLTVTTDDDGRLSFGHAPIDEAGEVESAGDRTLPER